MIVEQHHDDAGICWPASVAPADVHLVPVGKDPAGLEAAGKRVLLDDRGASAGVAFADADLIGVPTIVTFGRSLKDGQVEVKDRVSGERTPVPLDRLVAMPT